MKGDSAAQKQQAPVQNREAAPDPHASPVLDLTFRSSDLEEIEHMTNAMVSPNRHVPLSRDGAADGLFEIHGLRDFCSFETSYGLSVSVTLQDHEPDDRFAVVMASRGASQLIMKRQEFAITDQHAVVFPAGPPRVLNYEDDSATAVILMNRRKVAEHCAKLLGDDLGKDLELDMGFDLTGANGQSWVRLFQYATAELASPHSLFRHVPAARQQLEQTVITAFLLAHSHTYSEALLRPQSAAAPHYVKRAEAFIEAHFAEPLSLAEIAVRAGVSARGLQNGFQNFRNTTPMAFLRAVRLQNAHRTLLLADPQSTMVTEVALNCGFSHMGEFAAAYKRAFGETPRQTLLSSRHR